MAEYRIRTLEAASQDIARLDKPIGHRIVVVIIMKAIGDALDHFDLVIHPL
jgi:hypothetical protein